MRVYWPVALTAKVGLFCGVVGLISGIFLGMSFAPNLPSTHATPSVGQSVSR
jgi:hypothetical protein